MSITQRITFSGCSQLGEFINEAIDKGERPDAQGVRSRVAQVAASYIKEFHHLESWRWCPGVYNKRKHPFKRIEAQIARLDDVCEVDGEEFEMYEVITCVFEYQVNETPMRPEEYPAPQDMAKHYKPECEPIAWEATERASLEMSPCKAAVKFDDAYFGDYGGAPALSSLGRPTYDDIEASEHDLVGPDKILCVALRSGLMRPWNYDSMLVTRARYELLKDSQELPEMSIDDKSGRLFIHSGRTYITILPVKEDC